MPRKVKGEWIEGGSGDDILTGTNGRDTFVWRLGGGDDTITNFQDGDRLLVDFSGVYSDIIKLGVRFDGEVIVTEGNVGTTTFTFTDTGDDTVITAEHDGTVQTLTLLGVEPGQIAGLAFAGG